MVAARPPQQNPDTQSSAGQDQNDGGDSPDGADKPPLLAQKDALSSSQSTIKLNGSAGPTDSVPLPPPETGTYEKQPGHTVTSLAKAVRSTANGNTNGNGNDSSYPPSPTGAGSDWDESAPPTRPHSRAPSMSAGFSGGKLTVPKSAVSETAPSTPIIEHAVPNSATPKDKAKRSASRTSLKIPNVFKSTSTPTTPGHPATADKDGFFNDPDSAVTDATVRAKKPASVHSNDGERGSKFNLKDILSSGPKLSRKSSQRSNASSRRSDTDHESVGGHYPYSQGPKSTAGESTTSLSKKYGVCQKVAIGKGATSVVRLAHKWDRSEEKLYAIKEFRKRRKNESEKEYVKKLTAEFCISSTLHHINVVETVDLVQDENHKWCEVMEFCPGGDLYAAIKKGGMSPSEVECCFKQILSGVQYLHSQGVAHRDIKPENLFFDTKGHLKIGDYGASTVYRLPWETTVHMSTGLCGSEPYIAPEQFMGKPYDARLVDIWAVGIVYYCLHFQELPWRAAQMTDQLYQAYAQACASSSPATASCPPTINNLSPRACRPIIRRMLEPDPKHRADIEEVMKHAWVTQIEVCHLAEQPKHVHVHAQALAQAQLRNLDRD